VTREQLIAAEIYGYSFDNYEDHLGIGNVRYEELMPEAVKTLERAVNEGWPTSKAAELLKVDLEEVPELTAALIGHAKSWTRKILLHCFGMQFVSQSKMLSAKGSMTQTPLSAGHADLLPSR
jgi:hypothetical protein